MLVRVFSTTLFCIASSAGFSFIFLVATVLVFFVVVGFFWVVVLFLVLILAGLVVLFLALVLELRLDPVFELELISYFEAKKYLNNNAFTLQISLQIFRRKVIVNLVVAIFCAVLAVKFF
jgi:hypothetical protein